jgi:predicted MFS family arabinose efflux permease
MAALREPTEEPQPEPAARRGRAPARLAASSALTTSAMSVVGATAPDLRVHLGVGTAALTLVFVAQMLGAVVGSWLAGTVRHRLLELSPMAALAALAVLAAAVSPVLAAMAVAMWAAGVVAFVVNASSQAETMRRAGAGRARALSQFHVWGGAGSAAFPLAVAALLAAGLPWEAAFVLLAAGFAGYAIVNRRLHVVPPPRAPGAGRPHVGARGRWAVTLAVVGGGLQITFPLYYASLLVDRFGASTALASAGVSAYAFGILAARGLGTAALHRTGADLQLRLACVSLLTGYALLALAPSTPVVFAAGILLGLGTGQLMPLGMGRAAHEIGDDRYATGVVFTLNSALQMAVPGSVAVLLRVTDLRTALLCTLPLGLVVTLAVLRSRSPRG